MACSRVLVFLSDATPILPERASSLSKTEAALSVVAAQLPSATHAHIAEHLPVSAAARRAGVHVSAPRFWEQQGLLQPLREQGSRYRLYDEQQLRRLRIVALLRQANYDFAAIRATLDELEAGQPQRGCGGRAAA